MGAHARTHATLHPARCMQAPLGGQPCVRCTCSVTMTKADAEVTVRKNMHVAVSTEWRAFRQSLKKGEGLHGGGEI